MPNLTTVFFSEDDLGLDAITATVQETEDVVGPLLAISRCESVPRKRLTCFTHEDTNAPGQAIELRLFPPDGGIPTIPGKTLVCIGNCFVKGKREKVAAFR